MNKFPVRYITQTALMLAIAVLFQSIRTLVPALGSVVIFGPFTLSTLVIGTLVNFALIITAWRVGFWSGIIVSVLSTFIALIQGQLPGAYMIPVVSVGNAAIVALTWLLREKNPILAVAAGAAVKFLCLWSMVAWFVAPMLASSESTAKVANMLSIMFSWPQLITALLGGTLALISWPRLKKGTGKL